jgi:peptidyl-Asp metalloendopeptidase
MPRKNIRQIPRAIAAALYVTGVAGFTTASLAAPPMAEPALQQMQRVNDASLPEVAQRGTGIAGVFNFKAMDAADLTFTLSDGRVLKADRQRVDEDKTKGRKSWVGTFSEQPGSTVVFSTVKGVTTGFISYGAETWEVMPGKAGQHVLYRVDDSKLPSVELEDAMPPATDKDAGATVSDYGADATTNAVGGYVHDLLVVYTPAARVAYGQATLASMIQNAVAVANQAYVNSKVGITLNLVGLQEISYTEVGVQTSLNDLRGTSDGKMDSVHNLRNQVGADVVSLITQDADACGIAGVMTTVSSSFASNAFNVVKTSCLSQHSLAHEIGHNMGNKHDRESTTGSGAYPYSYGFRRCATDGTGFRTVMAYSCSGASRVAWFSNPNAYYNGYSTGIAYETSPTTSADNARSMNNTASTVAAFRTSSSTSPVEPTTPTAPSSLFASATSSSSVTIKWTDNSSDETGFKVERSGNGVDFTLIATLGAGTTSFINSGLPASTLYYYRVRAYNSAGNSSYSNTVSVTTSTATIATTVPAAPSSVSAADRADGSAKVSWQDASTNETSFQVRRETWNAKQKKWRNATTVGSVSAGVTSLIDAAGKGTTATGCARRTPVGARPTPVLRKSRSQAAPRTTRLAMIGYSFATSPTIS